MKRWFYRLRGENDFFGLNISNQEDLFIAFFISCHSLKDWLIKDGVAEKKEVENFINAHHCLKLAGDIANFSKHAELTRAWTGDKNTKAVGQKYFVNPSNGSSYILSVLEVQSDGKVYRNPVDIVKECLNCWSKFVTSKSLSVPEMMEENIFLNFNKWEPK